MFPLVRWREREREREHKAAERAGRASGTEVGEKRSKYRRLRPNNDIAPLLSFPSHTGERYRWKRTLITLGTFVLNQREICLSMCCQTAISLL